MAAHVPSASPSAENRNRFPSSAIYLNPITSRIFAVSSTCSHKSCPLAPKGTQYVCPCHGSQFSIEDGSVKGGPAPKGLPETAVKVDGTNVVAA